MIIKSREYEKLLDSSRSKIVEDLYDYQFSIDNFDPEIKKDYYNTILEFCKFMIKRIDMKILSLLCIILLCSCVSTDQSYVISTSKTYRHELKFQIEDNTHIGIAPRVQRASSYRLRISYSERIERQIIRTCARDIISRDISSFDQRIGPMAYGVENFGSCIWQIEAITKGGIVHEAMIDFTAGEELEADILCDGNREKKIKGSYLCQAYAGSKYQVAWFYEPVKVKHVEDCPAPVMDSDRYFKISPQSGICLYRFQSQSGKVFRLTVFGYDNVRLK